MAKYMNILIPCLAILYANQVYAQSDIEGKFTICTFEVEELIIPCYLADADASSDEDACALIPLEDYNMGLRVGSIFIILATSALGTYLPILLHRISPYKPGDIRDWLLTVGKFCKYMFLNIECVNI
jgi:zinc transporter 1/2/3